MKLKSTLLIILFLPIILFSQEFSDLSHLDCDSLFNLNGLSNQEIESKTTSLILTGEFEQALSWLNCLIKIDSNNPYFYSTRAAIRSTYFDDTLFISDYKKALKIDSNNLISNYNLGAEYYNLLDGDDSYSTEQKDTTLNKSCDFYINSSIKYFEKTLEIDSSKFLNLKSALSDLYLKKGLSDKVKRIENSNYKIPSEADSLNIPRNPKAYYFPFEFLFDTINLPFYQVSLEQLIEDRTSLAHFINARYSQYLFAFEEPLLNNNFFSEEIYRFTWLRSFNEPVVFRLVHSSDQNLLYVKMSNGAGGYGPGEIVIDSCLSISENEWNSFSNIIEEIDFWNLSPIEKTQVIGADGAQWILEGLKENTYHMVDRWNGDDKETSKACLYLLELSKLKIEKVY